MGIRVIAKLDVKPPNVVKPVFYEGLKVIGNTRELVKKYFDQGADEIYYIDIVASLYQRSMLLDEVQRSSEDIFIPFAVGGGVQSIEDFSELFHHGADKVAINTFAINKDPEIIDKAAKIFGSQSVVVTVEAQRNGSGWQCMSDGGKILTEKNVLSWIKEVEDRGAGEVFINSVDQDGSKTGFDIELADMVVSNLNIPVVVGSGAGKLEHIEELIKKVNPSGVAIASMLHYNDFTISDIKEHLFNNGIEVIR